MLGAAGAIAPEILGKADLIQAETALPCFTTGVIPPAGTYNYWADGYMLYVLEMALMGFAEHRRFQDWAKPGSMGKQYFLGLEKGLGGSGEPAYPGAPFFNPLGFRKDEKSLKDLKLKEVKNGRLAMLAILGYFIQGLVTGVGPYQNLLDHLADHVNVLTSLKFHQTRSKSFCFSYPVLISNIMCIYCFAHHCNHLKRTCDLKPVFS